MLHRVIALALIVVLSQVFSAGALAQTSGDPGAIEQIKSKVARLGSGEKARATVRLKDGTKVTSRRPAKRSSCCATGRPTRR